ncbi:MAG: insulinase family protein [Sphingobium sp.]|nr:insulinase family protein [Sphingobium sp.]
MRRTVTRSHILRSAAALALLSAPVATALFTPATAIAQASSADLVHKVDIPYSEFTLKNGLRVIVHTDRKAPVVAVSMWYNVGSKHEPKGKTGFAHLFEHLMFNGSENAPGDFFKPLQEIGATDYNGTTWFDRTNYFQTVPTGALDVALFLESDRMGHLLGAVTQETLDNQRGVVQNEKRQGDTQPYGMVEYAQIEGLLPADHPYGHPTIGSMADLDSASLDDVKQWFIDHYGPNNAILVLAGDVDTKTAKKLVTKYFGDIAKGKPVAPVKVDIPTLPARKDVVLKDNVATTRLYRWWAVPGVDSKDNVPLAIGAHVLGGLASSRLDTLLVKEEQLAVRVSATMSGFGQLGFFEVTADVKPGVDTEKLSKRLDEILSDYIAKGPSADEVKRVAMSDISSRIGGMEQVGGFDGKATILAQGALFQGKADAYKDELAQIAATTPDDVRAVMGKWLTRPVLALSVVPGERDAYAEAGAATAEKTSADTNANTNETAPQQTTAQQAAKRPFPEVGATPDIDFPAVESTTLSNGIKVHLARRTTVPTLRLTMSFNAGLAADPQDRPGTQLLMLSMLKEGTQKRSSIEIAEEEERLGASISTGMSLDRTAISLYALTPNLDASLDLLADVILHPAFDAKEMERVRAAQLTRIAQERTQPGSMAARTIFPLLYGDKHPYGRAATGSGDPEIVKTLTTNDLASFHHRWIRADTAEIFAVGNISLADLKAKLDARFAAWPMTRDMPGRKDFTAAIPAPAARIVLVNRPQSPQSLIYAAEVLNAKGSDDLVDLMSANDIMSGNFLSRTNMDLRETKGWSYGVRGSISQNEQGVYYSLSAPVQADKTGASIAALRDQITAFLGDKGITTEELDRTINGSVRELPGSFETSGAVLSNMQGNALKGRPFNYVETLAARYRAQTAQKLDNAARSMIDPAKLTWVVVGDKSVVLPQLQGLGLPVEVVQDTDAPRSSTAATKPPAPAQTNSGNKKP